MRSDVLALKNGSIVPDEVCFLIYAKLEDLFYNYPKEVFLDIASAAKDGRIVEESTCHILRGLDCSNYEVGDDFSFVGEDGMLSPDMCNVILSATEWDGMDVKFVNPIKFFKRSYPVHECGFFYYNFSIRHCLYDTAGMMRHISIFLSTTMPWHSGV